MIQQRINRVVENIIRSIWADTPKRFWSLLNTFLHASTGYNTFYVNGLTHPLVPLKLPRGGLALVEGEVADYLADVSPASVEQSVSEFLATRLNVLRHVRDAVSDIHDRQKDQAVLKKKIVLKVISSDAKYYLMLKAFLRM